MMNFEPQVSKKTKAQGSWTAVILAAGQGTRMKTLLPKVAHPVAGRPMIQRIVEQCLRAGFDEIRVVIGYQSALVENLLANYEGIKIFHQKEQKGTAHAVMSAEVDEVQGQVMILNGDHPLIEAKDLIALMESFNAHNLDLRVITAVLNNPGSLGRVIRRQGQLRAIIEAKDASAETLKVKEVNTGFYLVKAKVLNDLLPQIKDGNVQREFYLTDMIQLAQDRGLKVDGFCGPRRLAFGVNTQVELAQATRALFLKTAKQWMEAGVLILDPRTTFIEDTVCLSSGSVLYPMVTLRGKTRVGTLSAIETGCFIVDTEIGDQVEVKAYSHIERSKIERSASVGPFARLRPEVVIGEGAHIGNFVELKKVKFGAGSKAGHLTYLGDAEIGKEVNIGCGTITCNYAVDRKKYKTQIGDSVFVGSDTQFVAPVKVGNFAVIGSGSTITKDVPERALAIARARQVIKENYVGQSHSELACSPKSEASPSASSTKSEVGPEKQKSVAVTTVKASEKK